MRLEFLGGGAAHGLVSRVAAAGGVEVGGTFGPVGAMREKLLAGEKCDVVILTHAQLCELTTLGNADPDSIADLGVVRTSIAVRSGRSRPDVSTPEALRAALLAALIAVTLGACESGGQAAGGATENGGRGKVKLGLPF